MSLCRHALELLLPAGAEGQNNEALLQNSRGITRGRDFAGERPPGELSGCEGRDLGNDLLDEADEFLLYRMNSARVSLVILGTFNCHVSR